MNDFQMTTLANDHRQTLLAEAQRERLARATHATAAPVRRPRSHRALARRVGSGLLAGRVALF